MVIPPWPLITVTPIAPSEAVPDRITPIALFFSSAASERKKESTGRYFPAGSSRDPRCRTRSRIVMPLFGGMMYTRLGSTRPPCWASATGLEAAGRRADTHNGETSVLTCSLFRFFVARRDSLLLSRGLLALHCSPPLVRTLGTPWKAVLARFNSGSSLAHRLEPVKGSLLLASVTLEHPNSHGGTDERLRVAAESKPQKTGCGREAA